MIDRTQAGPSKSDREFRLDAHFALLDAPSSKGAWKRRLANWQRYAAVSGSAMAMLTGAAAALAGTGTPNLNAAPTASVRSSRRNFEDSEAVMNAVLFGASTGARPDSISKSTLKSKATAHAAKASMATPSIAAGGIVPLYGKTNTIQPGEWISIYGSNLAAVPMSWSGDFPTSLGGTSVTVNGRPAYLMYVSPGVINLQAPDDTARGMVEVKVTTASGVATSSVNLNPVSPSFNLLSMPWVSGIILRADGSGEYGGGSYDILGPDGGTVGLFTRAAEEGDEVVLFGVGFGPTNPFVPAGAAFSGSAAITGDFKLVINGTPIHPSFVGLSSAGLYQINFTVPSGLGEGAVPIAAMAGGMQTQAGVLFSLKMYPMEPPPPDGGSGSGSGGGGWPGGGPPGGGSGGGGGGGTGGGTGGGGGGSGGGGGGSGGGSGGGYIVTAGGFRYHPRLHFPSKLGRPPGN